MKKQMKKQVPLITIADRHGETELAQVSRTDWAFRVQRVAHTVDGAHVVFTWAGISKDGNGSSWGLLALPQKMCATSEYEFFSAVWSASPLPTEDLSETQFAIHGGADTLAVPRGFDLAAMHRELRDPQFWRDTVYEGKWGPADDAMISNATEMMDEDFRADPKIMREFSEDHWIGEIELECPINFHFALPCALARVAYMNRHARFRGLAEMDRAIAESAIPGIIAAITSFGVDRDGDDSGEVVMDAGLRGELNDLLSGFSF